MNNQPKKNTVEEVIPNQLFFDFDDDCKVKIKDELEDVLIISNKHEIKEFLDRLNYFITTPILFRELKQKYFPENSIANTQVIEDGNYLIFSLDLFQPASFLFSGKVKGEYGFYHDGNTPLLVRVHKNFLEEIK